MASNLTFWWLGYVAQVDETASEVVTNAPPLSVEPHSGMIKQGGEKPVRGLAVRFAGIHTSRDVNEFAGEYGLLGVDPKGLELYEDDRHLGLPESLPDYRLLEFDTTDSVLPRTRTTKEPLLLWLDYAELMRRLLRIYDILRRDRQQDICDIEDKLCDVIALKPLRTLALHTDVRNNVTTVTAKGQDVPFQEVIWVDDGRRAGNMVDQDTTIVDAAAYTLVGITSSMLQGGIHLEYDTIVRARDAVMGYRINESRYTYSPLAAAFYDLWEMITESRPLSACEACGRPIEASYGRRYCDNGACRQAKYDRRKSDKRYEELARFALSHQDRYTWDEMRSLWNRKGMGYLYKTTKGFQKAALHALKELSK
ncbi:MAG: hypothetical protein GX977_03010 [Firmicutes bacterium]|nr:hypothetical protein [Bacillota bacterium]